MIVDRIDPPALLKIPEIVNVSIATGTRIIHISGQTSVDTEGKVVGTTHLDQSRHAFRNVRTALGLIAQNTRTERSPRRRFR